MVVVIIDDHSVEDPLGMVLVLVLVLHLTAIIDEPIPTTTRVLVMVLVMVLALACPPPSRTVIIDEPIPTIRIRLILETILIPTSWIMGSMHKPDLYKGINERMNESDDIRSCVRTHPI